MTQEPDYAALAKLTAGGGTATAEEPDYEALAKLTKPSGEHDYAALASLTKPPPANAPAHPESYSAQGMGPPDAMWDSTPYVPVDVNAPVKAAYQYAARPVTNVLPNVAKGLLGAADAALSGVTGGDRTPFAGMSESVPTLPDVPELAGDFGSRLSDTVATAGAAVMAGPAAIPAVTGAIGLEGFSATYHTLTQQGVEPTKALTHAAVAGGVDAALASSLLGRLSSGLARTLGKFITDGFVFGAVSGAQQGVQDAIETHATDKDLRTLLTSEEAKKVGGAIGVGSLAGWIIGAAQHVGAAKGITDRGPALEPVSDLGGAPKADVAPEVAQLEAPTVTQQGVTPETVALEVAQPERNTSAPISPKAAAPPPEPAGTPAEHLTYDEAQKRVDDLEDANAPKHEIDAAYAARDAIGAREFQQTVGELNRELSKAGLSADESTKVLRHFGIYGDGTDALDQALAVEHMKAAMKKPAAHLAQDIAYTLMESRGLPFDEAMDITSKVRTDAVAAVKAVGRYLHEGPSAPDIALAQPPPEAQPEPAGLMPVSGETGAASGNGKGAAPVREPTGAKNETVDAELAAMGYEPGRHGDPSSFPEQWAKAKEIAAKDAFAGTKLVDDLADNTRPPTKLEVALLTHELNRRINERDVAEEAVRADPSEENIARRERAQNDYAKAADVSTRAGTESSGSLGFRRMMANRDFSLAATERKLEIAKGEKLTEAQAKTNADRSARIAKLEQAVAAIEDREALKQEVRARKPKGIAAVEAFLAPKADAALKRLLSTHTARTLGPDLLADAAIVGAHQIAKGAVKFEAWSKAMIDTIGEQIRPHLAAVWDEAQSIHSGAPKEQSRLKGAKTRTRKQIETVEGKTAANDFSKPERKPIEPDSELSGLRAQLEGAKREFKRTEFQFQREHRTNTRKAIDAAIEAKNFVGHWKTSFDMSAVLNQGAMHTIAHPIESARNVRMAARAAVSAPFYDRVNAALHAREHYQLGKKAGLALTAVGDDFSLREEQMRSRIAEKIPGIKHSARAFSTYLNLQRSQFFDAIVDGSPTKVTPELARDIADGVNTVTGRGNIRGFEKSIEAAGQILWAPRLYISQFQRVAGAPMYRGNTYTRKAFAGEYARFLVGSAAIYGLAALIPGSTVETDTRSSDFGKIKIGDSRLDPTGGLVQTATLVGREALGQTKTLDKGQVKDTNRLDVAMRFLRMKLAPLPGAVADILDKKNAIGEPVTPLSVAKDQFVPLLGRDIYEAMLAQGVPRGAALSLLSFFGMRLSTFDAHAKKAKK